MPPQHLSQFDHDLLIRVDTKMDRAATDIAQVDQKVSVFGRDLSQMNESLDAKIKAAVDTKAEAKDVTDIKKELDIKIDDHERRLRFNERYVWMAIGALTLAELLVAIYKLYA